MFVTIKPLFLPHSCPNYVKNQINHTSYIRYCKNATISRFKGVLDTTKEAEDVRQVLPEDARQLPARGREGLGHLRLLVRGVRAAGAGGAEEETETTKEPEREEGEERRVGVARYVLRCQLA